MGRIRPSITLFAMTVLAVLYCQFDAVSAAPPSQDEPTPGELVEAVTSGKGFPRQPCLSMEMQGLTANEIAASPKVRSAYEKLAAANRREVAETTAIATLEEQNAVWCLLSCLAGPREDNQIEALRSLERLGDRRAVPFLLIFAEYMAVYESGSENATIHGVIHQSVAKTLSTLTGVKVSIDGQDPEGLKRGIRKWRKWLVEYEQTDADTAGTESANTIKKSRKGHWEDAEIRVFCAGNKEAKIVTGKRGHYELSAAGRSGTETVIAFVGPLCGLPWVGLEQDSYIDTGAEVFGFHTIGGRIQWRESLLKKDGQAKALPMAEILATIDRDVTGGDLANKRVDKSFETRFNSYIKNPWMFSKGRYSSEPATPKITGGELDGQTLKLDLTDYTGKSKATVWVDIKSRKVTKVTEEPETVSDE